MTNFTKPRFTVGPSARVPKQEFPREVHSMWGTPEQQELMAMSPGRYHLYQAEDGFTFLVESPDWWEKQ